MASLIRIGIDIGEFEVRVVEVELSGNKKQLLNAFLFATPYTENRKIDPHAFLDKITSRIELSRLKSAKVAISLPMESIMMTTFTLPRMTQRELSVAAVSEAKRKMIPVYTPNHIFEYTVLGERIISKIPRFEISVIRSEVDFVNVILNIFNNVDIAPSLITPSCCVLSSSLTKEALKKGNCSAFLEIGMRYSNISIFQESKLFFTRNIVYGINDIIRDISHKFAISESESKAIIDAKGVPEVDFDITDKSKLADEMMRRKYGSESGAKTDDSLRRNIDDLELRMLLQANIDKVLQEFRRSLIFYKEQVSGSRVTHIFFLGLGNRVKNLFGILSKSLGGSCSVLRPFSEVQIIKGANVSESVLDDSSFVDASNLCLSVLDKDKLKSTVNFLPAELKAKEGKDSKIFTLRIFTLGSIVLLFILLVFVYSKASAVRKGILKLEQEIKAQSAFNQDISQLETKKKLIDRYSKGISELQQNRVNFIPFLVELARVLPPEVIINKLVISRQGMGIEPSGAQPQQQSFLQSNSKVTGQSQAEAVNKYSIEIEAQVNATYEQAVKVVEKTINNIRSAGYIKNISTTSLKLEKILASELKGSEEVTRQLLRKFSLFGDMVNEEKK